MTSLSGSFDGGLIGRRDYRDGRRIDIDATEIPFAAVGAVCRACLNQ